MTFLKISKTLLLLLGLSLTSPAWGQLIERPLPGNSDGRNLKIKSDTTAISLPLWDDFSTSKMLVDTSYWVSNTGVLVNPGIGKNPPTLNVVTLDGWDAFGNHYNIDPTAFGKIDSLVSRPIDLTKVPVSLNNTIYLSFFYQKEGNGDKPNDSDSLVLQFKKPDSTWVTAWPFPGEAINQDSSIFVQKTVQVTNEYIWEGFQFKFQAYGRQSGPFDTWNLDYIYLDKRRTNSGVNYLDRAFTGVPTSILGPYTAIPKEHFFRDPTAFLDSAGVGFTNLETQVQPVEYSVDVRDMFTGAIIDNLIQDSAFLALRYPLGDLTLRASFLDPSALDVNQDSIYLETRFHMDSGDQNLIDSVYNNNQDTAFVQSVDLRVNDTTFVVTVLDDYYAYDDGTPEFGAGVNQLNGQIAVQFVPIGMGIIEGVDINFQNIGAIMAGTPIEIFVLGDLENRESSVLGTTSTTVQVGANIDDFTTYSFVKQIVVSDTFYVGFKQSSDNFIAIGLDKNTNSMDRIFVDVTGTWEPNSEVFGSLLLRPRFGLELVSHVDDLASLKRLKVYPNPTRGTVRFSERPDRVIVKNLLGQKWEKPLQGDQSIDISDLPPSVYLVVALFQNRWEEHKIILTY